MMSNTPDSSPKTLLPDAIREAAPGLHLSELPFHVDGVALLKAIATVESSFGKHLRPRHEPAYDVGGRYYRRDKMIQKLVGLYGSAAAMSYGPFQIMYPVAVELGFNLSDPPSVLSGFRVNAQYAVRYLNVRAIPGATCLEDLFDAYNSGSHWDANIPGSYIEKAMGAYAIMLKK